MIYTIKEMAKIAGITESNMRIRVKQMESLGMKVERNGLTTVKATDWAIAEEKRSLKRKKEVEKLEIKILTEKIRNEKLFDNRESEIKKIDFLIDKVKRENKYTRFTMSRILAIKDVFINRYKVPAASEKYSVPKTTIEYDKKRILAQLAKYQDSQEYKEL